MENDELKHTPGEMDVRTALAALATEVIKLDQRTVELAEANAMQTRTSEALTNALERIMANHTIAFRRIQGLLVGLGADFEGEELRELRSLFNLEPPEGQDSDKTN